jgi:hypothetical protein
MDQEEFEEVASMGERPNSRLQSVLISPAEDSGGGHSGGHVNVNFQYDGNTGAIGVEPEFGVSFFHDPYSKHGPVNDTASVADHEADC